jgi:hypothetical protein
MINFERRKSIRIDTDILINYDKNSIGTTMNLCENGCCIEINTNNMSGKFLKILFSLPGYDKIMVIGNVVWTKKNEYGNNVIGLEFWYIEESDRFKINKYINEHIKSGEKLEYISDACV